MSNDTGLPHGWEIRHSNSKNLPYYFHPETKDSRWEPPAGTDPDKLKTYMANNHSSGLSSSHGGMAGGKIRCAHLLVKHANSRRPASWREAKITRSEEAAQARLKDFQEQIQSGKNSLSELATIESDCSSARKGGDLGFFGRGDMQKEFEEAAFALSPGDISPIVKTASGYHLIQRLE